MLLVICCLLFAVLLFVVRRCLSLLVVGFVGLLCVCVCVLFVVR